MLMVTSLSLKFFAVLFVVWFLSILKMDMIPAAKITIERLPEINVSKYLGFDDWYVICLEMGVG